MKTCDFDDHPRDECGVFGVYAPGEGVAKLTYYGLFALQHRGQLSAGIAASNMQRIMVFKDLGLVTQVFDEATLSALAGSIAIGHTRYTPGASGWDAAQPALTPIGSNTLAVSFNGNVTNFDQLFDEIPAGNNAELIARLISAKATTTDEVFDSLVDVASHMTGAFSIVAMTETALYAARDPHGVRPLALGRLANGWVIASETAALDIVGATFVRDVMPGEALVIDESGLHSTVFATSEPKHCAFEYVYLARPDSVLDGTPIQPTRYEMGRQLAREHPIDADYVIPVPDSGTPAAVGYAHESGVPFMMGLVKNAYVARTFIEPTQSIRNLGIRLKLNPQPAIIADKRLVVVDDSIVRGNTTRELIKMLRQAGAAEIHVRISSPPVEWPCFYGIEFSTRAELIAPGLTPDEVGQAIGADSLGYISQEGVSQAVGIDPDKMCYACFTGHYPIRIPTDQAELLGVEDNT